VRLGRDGENNLRLEVEAGAVPERVYIHPKRDSEGDGIILPTIDASKSPFSADYYPNLPDKKAEEREKALGHHHCRYDTLEIQSVSQERLPGTCMPHPWVCT
jgi:hypothetical protein